MQVSHALRKSYLFLIVLALLLSLLSLLFFVYFGVEWWSAYLSNLATGIVSSLIIIFLVDKIIERSKEMERLKIAKVALDRLRIPIVQHMILLCNIYKAATQDRPTPLPSTFEETFSDDYFRQISSLDFSKESPVASRIDWFAYLDSETRLLKERIEYVIAGYATYLGSELVGKLEKVINSSFIAFISQARVIPTIDKQHGFKRVYTLFYGTEDVVREHVSSVLELLEYYNLSSESPIRLIEGIWGDFSAPKWGSSRYQPTT